MLQENIRVAFYLNKEPTEIPGYSQWYSQGGFNI